MSTTEESPILSPNNVDESGSSLPSHEALSQPKTFLLNIGSSRGTKKKSWQQDQKFEITLLNLLMMRVQKRLDVIIVAKNIFVMERKMVLDQ